MKTGNTLRAARNSLLCFFMALGAGFLVACGGSGGGDATSQEFPAYLFDSAVKGVEYSGPTGNGSTGNGGVFPASDGGMFEFSIGATTLGSVRVNSDWPYVTPADFDDVDEDGVIAIARIMQGLDGNNTPEDGISIPRSARVNLGSMNLLADTRIVGVGASKTTVSFVVAAAANANYTIPSVADATDHFEATRNCLFSGGYVGSYSATVGATFDDPDEGKSYLVLDLFADEARRIDVSAVGVTNTFEMFGSVDSIGVIGSTITLSPANEFSFVTPRMVTGIYTTVDADTGVTIEAGTNSYTFVAGNPRATRRIAGFETETAGGTTAVTAMYVLDHFARDGDFRGQYYDVQNDEALALSLTIASGSWPANAANLASDLVLSGTRGDENTTVTLKVIRDDVYYGTFESVVESGRMLSGTWCDLAGSAGAAVPYQLPATPTTLSVVAQEGETAVSVTWNAVLGATSYKLYRSTVSGGEYAQIGDDEISALSYSYLDRGLTPETAYFYQLEACNFDGCSAPSLPVSVTTQSLAVAPAQPPAPSASAQSDTEIEVTWNAVSGATSYNLYRSTVSSGEYAQIGDDEISALSYLDRGLTPETAYFYQLEACNSVGCSAMRSPEVSVTTQATPVAPTQPSAPSASAQSDTEIEVTWSAVLGATSYKLYRSPSSGGTYTQVGGDISALSYLDRGLTPETAYFYQLEACNRGGCSSRSPAPAGPVTTQATPVAPTQPSVLSASAQSDSEIEVTWSAVSGATSYRLYRSPSSGGTYTRVGGDISELRHLDSGRSADTEYFYQLEACNRGGCSSRSSEVSATTPPVAPTRPAQPSASAQSDTAIEVTWSTVSGATSYRLYRSPSSGGTYTRVGGDISALRHLDGGLSASTPYYYQLEACNRGGCSSRSPEVSATTEDSPPVAPTQPAMPSASVQSDTEIEVTWSAVLGATSYRLYRSPSSGGTYTRVGGDISGFRHLDSGRSAGTEYFYQLEACNSTGCSSRSSEVSATTFPVAPATPSASAQSDSEIEVTWSAVSGATSYRLYRSPSSGGTYTRVGGDISGFRHLDSGRSAGTEYFYQLEACNSTGCSSRSSEVSATTFPVAPATPNASAQSDSEIEVTWSAVSGATSYRLYRSPSSGGTYTRVGGDISGFRHLDSGRSAGTEYFYQLEACNSGGCSSRSLEVSATTFPVAPATPSASAQSDSEIEVTWSAVSGATSYRLYRSPSSGGTYTRVGGDISGFRHLDSGRSAGTEYFYQLEACNSGGCSSRSLEVSATTFPVAPATPSASAQSDTEIEVTWSAVSGATSYRLYRSPSSGGTYTRVGGDISGLRHLDSGRSADTEYFYQLEACNSGGCSSRSSEVSATTLPVAPAQPSAPSASAQSDSEIEVTWSAVSGATSYRLYRSPSSGGTYTRVGGDISALRHLDSGRSADTEYFYQLEACNRGGCSSRSLEVSATTPPVAPVRPATPSASAQSDTEIEVTWSAVSGATSYRLYRSPSSGGTYAQIGGDISVLRYLDDSGLSAGTEYFYQLEACNSVGCSSRSPEVSVTTPPVAPATPSASAQSDTEIEVTWSAVSGATSYRLYRSTSSGGTYTQVGGNISALRHLDSGRSAGTTYYYQLEACNSAGCSSLSPEVSATTNPQTCSVGLRLTFGKSCIWRGQTFMVESGGLSVRGPRFNVPGINSPLVIEHEIPPRSGNLFRATRSGTTWTINRAD